MKKIAFALTSAAAIALAGCGGQGDDALGENVQENMEAQAENLEAMGDNAGNAAAAEALGEQAEQLEQEGARREEAIDDADVNAANQAEADAAVNGM